MRSIELRFDHLTFSWPGGREILRDLNGRFELEGVVALCGLNGSGKSTLLALLAGELEPAEGRLHVGASSVALSRQRVEDAGSSPGEAQRRRIDALFGDPPDLLLLDEPTNHLDARALRELEGRLRRRRAPTVLVSHDRELLDRLARCTLWVEEGGLVRTEGGFSRAWLARQERMAGVLAERRAQDDGIRHLRARLQGAREEADAARGDRSAGSRMRSIHDSDARGIHADFRYRTAESRLGRGTAVLRDELARLEAAPMPAVKRDTLRDVVFPWDAARASKRLSLPAGSVATPGGGMISHGGVVIDGRTRARLEGANGAGKTTLLAALAAATRDGVFHLPQEPSAEEDRALLDALRAADPKEQGRILSLAAALGASGESLRATAAPSPGEARKLRLAVGLASSSWMLLLDEPTNHLDAASIQRLQEALERWPGGLVLCTHDERLARAVAPLAWRLVDHRLMQ